MVSGVTWAVLTIVTGGLEAAIAAHAVSNLLIFLVGGAYGGLDVVDDTSLADAPLAVSLLSSGTDVLFVLLVVAVVVVLRRRGSRLAPASRAEPVTATAPASRAAAPIFTNISSPWSGGSDGGRQPEHIGR
jgi:hypothetical protein